jgi:hypothetical protein
MSAPEQANWTKCPTALDELRDALALPPGHWLTAQIQRAFNTFAAAHPGLVDLTIAGPQCPACSVTPGLKPFCDSDWGGVYCPVGEPCPVMAERGEG